jgi:quercetin 2,3-dioxygenase
MSKRKIEQIIRGQRAVDGAGVRLVRVLGYGNTADFDPFLMLDSFDSTNPTDYIAGFPMHPHRGIETITYLISGKIEHEDSLGNKGAILAGESQWMTSGNGILHQEMPKPAERMLGFQLWLNLPRSEKMAEPAYLGITRDKIPTVAKGRATVRVLSGSFENAQGVKPNHIQASMYDIGLPAGEAIELPTRLEETVFVFLIEGDGVIDGQAVAAKSAVLFGRGDTVAVAATPGSPLRFMFFSAPALHEPVAWGGPIVMNTDRELELAFDELRRGTFIRHR